MMSRPLTHRRTPSLAVVRKVYVSEYAGVRVPVMRVEKESAGRPVTGLPVPKSRFTVDGRRSTGTPCMRRPE